MRKLSKTNLVFALGTVTFLTASSFATAAPVDSPRPSTATQAQLEVQEVQDNGRPMLLHWLDQLVDEVVGVLSRTGTATDPDGCPAGDG